MARKMTKTTIMKMNIDIVNIVIVAYLRTRSRQEGGEGGEERGEVRSVKLERHKVKNEIIEKEKKEKEVFEKIA